MVRRISSAVFGAALLALCGHRAMGNGPPGEVRRSSQEAKKPTEKAAKKGGPGLQGRIVNEAEQPLRGAKVILYAGVATRWKIAEAETDADGRYRFDSVQSSMVKDQRANRWDQYVGVRVEHPTHVEADGRSWRDIRIPGIAGHVETLDLKCTTAGHINVLLKDAKTGEPLKKLDLRIMTPSKSHGHGATFDAYAKTDDQGRFRSISLFPGEYDVEVNSTTLDYPVIGQVKVEPGKVTAATFDAVSLPRVLAHLARRLSYRRDFPEFSHSRRVGRWSGSRRSPSRRWRGILLRPPGASPGSRSLHPSPAVVQGLQ
jgi:hypothetical protein